MATGIDRFNEIYDSGIKSEENKGKAVKNSEQVDRFNAMYEKSGAGYIAYKKYVENTAKFSQKVQSDYANRAGKWQSADVLAQNKADTLAAFDQLGNKDALLNYGYTISDPKQRRAYFDSILSVDDYKRNVLKSYDDEAAYWGQWNSEDAYKNSEAYFVNTYNDSLPDWEEKSKPNYDLANGFLGIPLDHTYNYINDKPTNILGITDESLDGGYRDQYKAKTIFNSLTGGTAIFGGFEDDNYKLSAVTDDDVKRYNYIYATEGKDEANKYLKSIQDRLSLDYGQNLADNVSGNALATIGFPVLQGLTNFKYGIKGLLENEAPINPYAVAGEKIKENIDTFEIFGKDFGQVMYDLGATTANMLPSIMVDIALGGTGKVGSFLMGASAAGNARQEALRQGYTQEQAWAYGAATGVLETCLQYAMGGIGKLGGKGSSFVLKKLGSTSAGQAVSRYIANLSNGTFSAVLQAGGKLAGNMASEGLEEYLQDVINPLTRNITLGENNEWGLKNFVSEDAIYSGILGALSAGLLEGGSTVSGVYNARKAGQAAFDSGIYKGAIDYAMLLDPECDAYQIASELQSGKRKENAANIGALYEAVSEYMAESKKLVKKGKMTTDQYAGGVEALRQLADARAGADIRRAQQAEAAQTPSSAEVQTAANTVSAPVLDSAVYNAVKTVESNESAAVKAANIIARIESGNSKLSAAELSYISSPATKARQILQQRTGINMGTTASQARNAVKEYISQRSASVSQETVNKRSAEIREAKTQSIAVNTDPSVNVGFDAGTVGSAGAEAYTNHYSALKTEQGQRYFNSAFAALYQAGMQGVPFKKISKNLDLQGMSVSTQAEIYNAAVKDYQAVNQIKAETKKAVHDRVKEIRERVREQKNGKVKKEYAEIDKKLIEKREVKAGTFTMDERIDRSKLSGKQKAAVKYLKALSEVAGINVNIYSGIDQNGAVTAENGYYDPQTNTIYVSVNAGMSNVNAFAESAILRTASHEITHMIKASGTELYVDLRDYVIETYVQEYGQNGLTERILDIQQRHREIVGKELTYEQAEEELVSSACEMMLKDSKAFAKLAKRNLTLAQRVKSALDAFISHTQKMLSAAFKGDSANSAEARLMQASVERMEKLQQLWDRALLDAAGREAQVKENIKFSFAGASAKNADLSLLAQAQIKIENGENAETVRQETGWYKGYDGKWRFEIDDSEITLKEKDITSGASKIGDVLADCELLKAYPQLKDITISARPMLLMGSTDGWFSAANNEIVLNSKFLENAQVNHELEALYRTNEYKEYNVRMEKAADERNVKRSEIVKEYQELCNSKEYADYTERWNKADDADNKGLMNRIEHEWRTSEKGKRFYELQKQLKEISQDNILDRITNEFQRTETGKRYLELVRASEGNDIVNNETTKKALVHELQHAVQQIEEFASGANLELWENHINEGNHTKTPTELYHLTAGEIEARDAAARLSYDMEQRRNTRPDIDQKNVVFADGEIVFYASSEEKGTIKEQLKAHLTEINKMKPVASIINEGRKGMSREQQVDAIMSDYNRKFKGGVPRENFGFVEINENLVRGSLRYIYTDAEYAAFYAIPNVIKSGIEISEHRNHKGRSYETLTIAAPVNINGSRGNVAVVIKQTGKNRYKTHRILMPDGSEFILQNIKNEELTGADMLANNNNQGTAISSSSIINIPNSDENVNKMLEMRENPAQKKFENDVDAVMNGTYDAYLPRTKGASDINGTTSSRHTVSQEKPHVDSNSMQNSVMYELRYTTDNKPVAVITENILSNVPTSQWVNKVKQTISERFAGGIPVSGRLVKVNAKTRNEFTFSKNTQWYERNNSKIYSDKFKASGQLDEIVLASTNYVNEDLKHSRKDSFVEFARGDVLLRIGSHDYSAKVIIGFTEKRAMVLYDVIDFSQTSFKLKTEARSSTAQTQGKPMRVDSNASAANRATAASEQADANTPKADRGSVSNKSIPNLNEDVNKMLELRENPAQKKFENDVDAVMNGTYKSDAMLILGRTPKALEAIGLNALPVAITPNHVYSIAATKQEAVKAGRYNEGTNYHGLGVDAVKQIYQKISDPIAVIAHPDFAAKNKRDSAHKVVVLVDLSVNGKQVIAPITVDYEGMYNGKHIDVNLVATYFDKSNVGDFLKEAVALETNHKVGFFYGKKERIRQLLMKSGHQLPSRLNNSDSDIIIRRIDENVNRKIDTVIKSQQFIRWFGDWQNDSRNASKVVNEDGTPKTVYRAGKSDFTAAELQNNREIARAVEEGFYFTDIYNGDKASESVYLNIKKPFMITDENRQTAERDILRGNYDGIIDADNGAYFVYNATQIKSAADNIGTFDGKNADIRYELRINEAVEKAIRNKGQLETEYNQQRISPVPENIAKMVLQASNGKIDITGKYFAVSGGDLYHEYVRHSNVKTEQSRNQIALTAQDIKKAVQIFYQPDIVECIFEDGDNPSGRKSFAFAKKDAGYILVVESVGGRHNPNIVPVMILHVTEGKWHRWIDGGKSIAEMVYESSPKYLESIKNNAENIKNRVTAARFAETQPPLNAPHSPRSNSIISGLDGNVNAEAENIKNRVTAARFAEAQPPQSAPHSPRFNNIVSESDGIVNREFDRTGRYSYDALVRKPDMQITPLRTVSPEKVKEYIVDRRKFAREMMQLARKADNAQNTEKTTWLRNNDLNSDIMVSAESFKHSAERMDADYIRVCMSMSDIVKNAVAVNELPPQQDTAGAYVLLGMAHDGKGYTAVRMVVNKKTWKMEDYHILYAVKEAQIKEKVSGTVPPGSSTKAISDALLSSSISIQDMLQLVKKNDVASSVLSEDALQRLQATRGSGLFGESVLYELRSDPAQAEWEKPITAEDVDTLRSVGRKSVNEFTSEDIQKTQKWAHKFYKELGEKSPFFRAWFGDWRAYDTTPFKLKTLNRLDILNRADADIYFKKGLKDHSLFRGNVLNNDTKFKINVGQKVYNDTLTYAAREFSRNGNFDSYLNRISLLNNISAITKDAVLFDTIVAKENSNNPDQSFVHQFYYACQIGQKSFIVKLIVDELNSQSGTIRRSYNVNSIEISPAAVSQVYKPASTASDSGDTVSIRTVSDLFALVKENDANFQPKAAAAALLNANGTPRQLYRWESKNGKRTNFGEGVYLTASKALAERAGGKAAPAYVKLENPYTVYGTAFSKADYAEIGAWAGIQVSAKNVTEALQALGYDGVVARSTAGNHPILAAVAFDTVQTKSSENVGTFNRADADVRYELRNTDDGKTDKQSKNLLDEENLRSYNKRGRRSTKQDVSSITMKSYYHHAWATNELTGVLDADEIGMFNAAVGNIKNGTGRGYRTLSDDLYLVDVGTYFQGEKQVLIVTDADYEAPSIECVYRIDFEQARNVSLVKEEIYDAELVQREILGATFTYDRVASEESAYHRYTRESAFSFQEFDEQRRERSAGEGDRGYYRSGQGRSGYPGEAGSAGGTNESRVTRSSFDSAQTNSSQDADTFNRSDADVRYELRESELTGNEIASIHRTQGAKVIELILMSKPKEERKSLANVLSFIYSKAISAESVHDLEGLNGKVFSDQQLQLIYDAAKEDVQNYKLYKIKFFNELNERLNELKSKDDYSQEIGEQGKLFENLENQPVREIIEYNELSYKGNPEEVKKEIEKLSAQKREAIKLLDKLCQVSGIKIEIALNENSNETADGGYSDYEKTVRISVDKEGVKRKIETGVLNTASHELTHMLKHEVPELYEALSDFVTKSYIQETSEEAYIEEIKGIMKRYNANNGQSDYLSYEQAENEFVCYACELMLKNSTVFENLAMRNRTLAQKLSEGLHKFIEKIKELLRYFIGEGKDNLKKSFEGTENLNDIAKVLASNIETLKEMQKRWDAALIKTVENRKQFNAKENYFRKAVNEWKNMHRNERISFAEEERLKRGVAKQLLQNWSGEVPISGKLTQVENVYPGKYDTYYTYDKNGMQQESIYWIQTESGKYNVKKDENGRTIEFELGTTKHTKFFSFGTEEEFSSFASKRKEEAKRLKANGEISLEAALNNAKTFFHCEIPVRMRSGGDYIVEAIVSFPAEKKKLNRTVNYEQELNKIIKEAMRTGKPVVDSTADRIFDDMVLYDVINVRKAK